MCLSKIMTLKNLIALFEFILITVKVSNFFVLSSKIGLLPKRNKTDQAYRELQATNEYLLEWVLSVKTTNFFHNTNWQL